jgi:hypoxanthine phosphoribosyltransferase|tara:strand:- start:73 stop:477 length:405 start_codon:yes stop_codon:yes gene_type:complete
METKKIFITWQEVNELLDKLYDQCKGEIDLVTGVPRGGTILAILFSHRFDIQYMSHMSNHYPKMLILDDIADSGKTFKDLEKDLPTPKYAALHYKNTSVFKPDYYAQEIEEDFGWVVYPWEKKDSNTVQDYLDN